MISKEDFIRVITEHGHESRLRYMTLEQIRSLRHSKEHGMCVLCTGRFSAANKNFALTMFDDIHIDHGANMFLYNPLTDSHSYYSTGALEDLLDERDGEYSNLEYYIIPTEEMSLDIEELI